MSLLSCRICAATLSFPPENMLSDLVIVEHCTHIGQPSHNFENDSFKNVFLNVLFAFTMLV